MLINRNWTLKSPSVDEILLSGLADERLKPVVAWAYKGAKPTSGGTRGSRGYFVINKWGIAFLTRGGNASLTGMAEAALVEIAGNVIPFGGTLATALIGFGRIQQIPDDVRQYLEHPSAFVIPHIEMVRFERVNVGSFLTGKRDYLVVMREKEKDNLETYCVTPCETGYPDLLIALRFQAEKDALMWEMIEALTSFSEWKLGAIERYKAKYGENMAAHANELSSEMVKYVNEGLAAKGSSLDEIDQRLRDRLQHFRYFKPLAKYFGVRT